MQVGGIGNSGLNGHSSTHQVTNCIHDHGTQKQNAGPMRISSSVSLSSAADSTTDPSWEGFSLANILRGTVSFGKRLWGRIWTGGADGTGSAVNGAGDGSNAVALQEQVLAQIGEDDLSEQAAGMTGQSAGQNSPGDPYSQAVAPDADIRHNPRVAAASTAVQAPQNRIQDNPYFTTTSDPGKVKENIFQKIRVKFRDITGQLAYRFTGKKRFAGESTADSRQQRQKEDLRKHSRYREKDLEIDCVLTDDSYLMDSYDRKGEYSRLSTETNYRGGGS